MNYLTEEVVESNIKQVFSIKNGAETQKSQQKEIFCEKDVYSNDDCSSGTLYGAG